MNHTWHSGGDCGHGLSTAHRKTRMMSGISNGRVFRLGHIALAASAVLCMPCAWAKRHHFEIPAGPATATLSQFQFVCKLNVFWDLGSTELRTQAVSGDFEPPDALRIMLKGTGYGFVLISKQTLLVKPLVPSAPVRIEDPPVLPEVVLEGSMIRGELNPPLKAWYGVPCWTWRLQPASFGNLANSASAARIATRR